MKGDLSSNTYKRSAHYSAVRMQQGRVITDADFNEQADITRHRDERLARDVVGRCGAPMDNAGFALTAETNALSVLALNANVAWITAEDGVLLRTTNNGATWALTDLDTTAQMRAAGHAGNVGWAVGDGGTVRKTSNQGASWIAQDAGTLATLRGVSVFDATHAWAVGDGGVVVATSDGGANWSLAKTEAARLYAVAFTDEFNGLAVGQAGAIESTVDGGETWTTVDSGTDAHLRALTMAGTTLAWAAGSNGTILRSEDGGATWLAGSTPVTNTLHAIAFRDAEEGWAVGESGTVLHSVDGGATWTLEDAGTGATLRGLSIFTGSAPWAVGDASTALRLGGGSPDVVDVALPAVNLSIGPGRYYVDGTMCELDERASFAHQSDGGAPQRLAPGEYIVYIDAWQRHISSLEAPEIREVALGGPDTATRGKTIAQVRTLALPSSSPSDWNCDSSVPDWEDLINAAKPRMAARAEPQLASTNLCDIAATAGFRRLKNQLYRVEVHTGGASPTFKWSRENGSVAYAVTAVSVDTAQQQTVVRVAARGRDANLDVSVHDRLELVDDDAELGNRAGVLFEYLNDGDDELELVLAGVPGGPLGQDLAKHPVLRRWDHHPTTAGDNALPIVEGTWIDLEEGVQVRFEAGGVYRPGDYWQIPARTITADVEWPRTDDGDPVAQTPAGIADAYCRLGIVEVDADGTLTVTSDCRELFPPLTAMEQLLYVSGDGQDVLPNTLLPQPLAVRVARGSVPVKGMRIRFDVDTGGGRVGAGTGGSPVAFETTTDDEGQASCRWTLGPGSTAPSRYQRVRATLLNADGEPFPGQQVVFCATGSPAVQGGGRAGCDITIGRGGDFERLDSEVLRRILAEGDGAACICFMPGTHAIERLDAEAANRAGRLSLHGCGHASLIRLAAPISFSGFASVQIRDLVMAATAEAAVVFKENAEIRLESLSVARPRSPQAQPVVQISAAQRVSMVDCDVRTVFPAVAVVLEGITGTCQMLNNRIVGVLSFYGDPGNLPNNELLLRLNSILNDPTGAAPPRLEPGAQELKFCDNTVSLLAIGAGVISGLIEQRAATGLFETATITGNTIEQSLNLFIASRMAVVSNCTWTASPTAQGVPYGLIGAERAIASGNITMLQARRDLPLIFGARAFDKAANVAVIQP
ncbi:DUF6519 domain-containing protein [Variovorax sp. J22R133]|uniref:DUF6519 domain-containing protein n=1 Tax=Variovorax brevis TaxID=3053503 RepID=UPI0025758260|nr:DUF6519 domain-containing protein [Variovorax sp. J22R133]MDM0112235.1 DUF6519 domain-containing protein [Variovorax sp. J22R133]